MANDNTMYDPEIWAQTSLMYLEGQMRLPNLVHRDFDTAVQNFGDVVNTRKPQGFVARRKDKVDTVTVQDATSTNVAVPLDQLIHTSFMIFDGEEATAFTDLAQRYIQPAVASMAQAADEAIIGEIYGFLSADSVNKLGTDIDDGDVRQCREVLNKNKVPDSDRFMVLTPAMEGALLGTSAWTKANEVGDNGSALRDGMIGKKYGFDIYLDNYMPSIATGNSITTGAVNLSAGYAAGTTSMTVSGFSADLAKGQWFTVAGDMTPQQVLAAVTTPWTTLTFTPGLRNAVANSAVITVYDQGTINYSAGYDAGYGKVLTTGTFSVAPKAGQIISFADSLTERYSVLSGPTPTTTACWLNRPLSTAVAHAAVVNLGPAGEYGFAAHRNAIAFVNRPLPTPKAPGALSAVANYNGLSIRVTMAYVPLSHGHVVTLDMLCGVKVLDTSMGVVMFG